MKILLYDQQKSYLNLVIKKLKHYFDNTIQILICMNLQELKIYDNQLIGIAIIADNDKNLEILRSLKARHHESQIIYVGENYLYVHEIIRIGVKEYLIMPLEINVLCISVERFFVQNAKLSLPLKNTGRKHIFMTDEIKYIETSYNDFIIATNDNQYFISSIKNSYCLKEMISQSFLQVNQSVFINCQYIDYITEYQVILHSREIFQINDKYLLKKYMEETQNAHRDNR